jgi:hypothetical protein
MESISKELDELKIDLNDKFKVVFFRARKHGATDLGREEIFHIPFDSREKVRTQRFSLPGVPCLYLSGSLYTCWEEIQRLPFHLMQCSAFWLKAGKNVKLLNLSTSPRRMELFTHGADNGFLKRNVINPLIVWPLLAACSVRVSQHDAPFKPEYVIPQLLLQWIGENGFAGISHFSTHIDSASTDAEIFCNFIFPATKIATTQQCSSLEEIFDWTKPVNMELLAALKPAGPALYPGNEITSATIEFSTKVKKYVNYKVTRFGLLEEYLRILAFNDHEQVVAETEARKANKD